ncbi:MAG: DUF1499 domain-containing protein [Pseudomonadota bacterium]
MSALKSVFIIGVVVLAVGGVGFFLLGLSSQSGSAPGLADGQLAPCPGSPNCVSSEEGTPADKKVDPLATSSWDAIPATISALGGSVTQQSEDYIAAEFKSALFGFVDDVEFRKAEDAVHVRSASRVGYSDAGVNAARVKSLREKLGVN